MLLSPPAISTDHFTYSAADRLFVGEASTLFGSATCPGPLRLGRVFDDACDVGFVLVSSKSGGAITMCENGREVDAEGDLLYTEFAITDARGPVREPLFIVRIYND